MLRAGHGLILIVVSLLAFGVVMVNSAALTVDAAQSIELRDVLLGRTTIFAVIAAGMMMLGSRVPIDRLYTARGFASPVPWIALGSIALLLSVHIPSIGQEVNGARRWINLGFTTFQPSELVKWGILIVLAWHGARWAASMHKITIGFLPPLILIATVCGLIGLEDLGTAVLIGMVSMAVLIAAGCRVWQALLIAPAGAVAFAAAVIHSPYRLDRLRAFLDPYQDPQGIGYHVLQSMAAVSGGGLAGRGLGNGVHKFGYLPEDTTDFIFAIICEELGFVGAATVVFLYAAMLVCGFSIIRRVDHPFHRLLGLGILLTIGFQAVINIAVVTGAAPTKGIALPLLSSGGTGWVVTAFSVGLLVSMDKRPHVHTSTRPHNEDDADEGVVESVAGSLAGAG
jgi:cell division protein FtsW